MRKSKLILAALMAAGAVVATATPASAGPDPFCDPGEFCLYEHIEFGGKVYTYTYPGEDWNFHDGVVDAPADQDSSWLNKGPKHVQIYKFGGNNRGGLRTPTLCIRPHGGGTARFPSASDQGSGFLWQDKCHPDSPVV